VASAKSILRQVGRKAGDGASQVHACTLGMVTFVNYSLIMQKYHDSEAQRRLLGRATFIHTMNSPYSISPSPVAVTNPCSFTPRTDLANSFSSTSPASPFSSFKTFLVLDRHQRLPQDDTLSLLLGWSSNPQGPIHVVYRPSHSRLHVTHYHLISTRHSP
jgi:hypothetical protein